MINQHLDAIEAKFHRLVVVLGVLVALSIGWSALAITADLFMRRLGIGNIPWLNELLEYLLFAGVFLAAPWVLRSGAHVRIDVIFTVVSQAWGTRLEQVLNVVGAILTGALCYYGIAATLDAYALGAKQYKALTVATWWLTFIFAFAGLLLTVEFLFRLRRTTLPDHAADTKSASEF